MLRGLTSPPKGGHTAGAGMWQAAVSDTAFQPLNPQVQMNRWKWISEPGLTEQAALLPPTSYTGQAIVTDGEDTKKASTILHQKSRDEGWMLRVKRVFSGSWN